MLSEAILVIASVGILVALAMAVAIVGAVFVVGGLISILRDLGRASKKRRLGGLRGERLRRT